MDQSIVGVWTLQSFHMNNVDTGERSEPFGPEPRGSLILDAGGRMVVLFTPGPAPAGSSDPAQAAAPQKLMAYSGRYRLEAPDRIVTAVEVASFAHWVGTEQVRTYRLDGDRLDLFTPTGRMPQPGGGEATVSGILSWTRDRTAPAENPARGPA